MLRTPLHRLRVLLGGIAAGAGILVGAAPAGSQTLPAVTRPSFQLGKETRTAGVAFFISLPEDVPSPVRAAALTTAHGFDLSELVRAQEVVFTTARTKQRASVSSRLLGAPGRPYNSPGATVRDDYLLFALDLAPTGARILELDSRPFPAPETRVQILGIPHAVAQDEDDVFGEVVGVGKEEIEVDLDAPVDLRGWGGAPVLDYETKKVIGLVQAARPVGPTIRLSISPLGGIREALAAPLEGGSGRAFARFEGTLQPPTTIASAPGAEDAATRGSAPHTRAPAASAPAAARTASPGGAAAPIRTASVEPDDVGPIGTSEVPLRPEGKSLLPATAADIEAVHLQLAVDAPTEGEVVGDDKGAFVTGRALALAGEMKRFDVVFVIDTSGSTAEPSGADIDGNGTVGKHTLGGIGSIFGTGSTDAGDSVLAAEVMSARKLLEGLDSRNTRVGLVTFAGDPPNEGGFVIGSRGHGAPAITEEPLTTDYGRIRKALDRVLVRGPDGMTHIAAGLDQATIELLGLQGALSKKDPKSEKIVLFLTDGQPTLPFYGAEGENVRAALRAAERARRAGIRVNTFALGEEALQGPVTVVEMAARTKGYFTPVRTPGDIVDVMEHVSFANLESVTVRNASTGVAADVSLANADGTFGALVPLQPGKNHLEVTAKAAGGLTETRQVTVTYVPGTPSPPLPRELVAMRNRLLEQKLIELRRGNAESEQARIDEKRKELDLEIQRERAAAQDRAAQQRKELDIDVLREPPAATGASRN
ncbi:MAG TPA: VWA domain-containing protein [Myxococcota bacterium]|nr:VWA domain-containing protein [Myxococcota bacterium]